MREFGQTPTSIWSSVLSKPARLLYAYLTTCPHSNMLGCFNCPPEYVAGDTGLRPRAITEAEADLIAQGYLVRFGDWVYLPRFTAENPIHSGNNAKHRINLWEEIDNARVREAVAADILARNADLPEELRAALRGDSTLDPTLDPTGDSTGDSTLDPTLDPTGDSTGDSTLDPTGDSTGDSKGIDRQIDSNNTFNPPPSPPSGGGDLGKAAILGAVGGEPPPEPLTQGENAVGSSQPLHFPEAVAAVPPPKAPRFNRAACLSEVAALPLSPWLDVAAFRDTWLKWIEYRLEHKSRPPNPVRFFENQLEQFPKKFTTAERAAAALESVMLNGWQGFEHLADKGTLAAPQRHSSPLPRKAPAFR